MYGFGISSLLRIMGANETLYPYAMAYMKYINLFLPVEVFSNYIAIFVCADGNPNRAMVGVLLGGVVNIVLDILFVFSLHMGIGGAAFASVFGMVVQVIVGISHRFSRKNGLKLIKPKHIVSSVGQIIGNGIPSFFNELANGFIVLLFNIQILKYCGDAALSIYSVISNCVILFNSLFTSVGQAIQPIVATNYGADKWNRIQGIRKMSYLTIVLIGIVFSLNGILFPLGVCSVFMKIDSASELLAQSAIRTYFIAFLPMGINLLPSYYLQSILSVKKSLCISVLRNVLLSGIAIFTFPLLFGAASLWRVMPVVEVLVLVVSVAFLRVSKKKVEVR